MHCCLNPSRLHLDGDWKIFTDFSDSSSLSSVDGWRAVLTGGRPAPTRQRRRVMKAGDEGAWGISHIPLINWAVMSLSLKGILVFT